MKTEQQYNYHILDQLTFDTDQDKKYAVRLLIGLLDTNYNKASEYLEKYLFNKKLRKYQWKSL